jgi:hypothetical protein
MATAPTSRRLNLTRDQLATFLTDQQQIRQFELLFATVDQIQVIVGTDFEYQADTAAATANEALAQISRLAQALELVALAPRQELGTISSQNSDNVNITGGLISGLDAPLPIASGGTNATTAAAARTNFGATTVGSNLFTLPNPSAVTYIRINADNSISTLDAATFRTAIGAGTGSGTVTSVAAITLGTTGTDLSSTVASGTTTPVITLNVPTASATNRGALSSADWSSFRSTKVLTWLSM